MLSRNDLNPDLLRAEYAVRGAIATRAQRFELMRQQNMAIRAVLTPDQQTVFDKNVADMNARMRRPPQ